MKQNESHKHKYVDWEKEQLGSSMENVYAQGVLESSQRVHKEVQYICVPFKHSYTQRGQFWVSQLGK